MAKIATYPSVTPAGADTLYLEQGGASSKCTAQGVANLFAGGNMASAINWKQWSPAIASAATTDIGGASGNFGHVSGTTTITSFGTAQAGSPRLVVFDGALTLTYNATSLILPTAANITTAAGDCALFVSEGSGNWRCTEYQKADGTPLVGATISNGSVTNAKLANMANSTIKGRTTAGTGSPEDMTAAQTAAIVQGDGLTADLCGFRGIPQNSQSAAYTLVAADAGKHIYHPSTDANARTFTIPANSSVAFPVGTSVTFVNETSQVVSIAITTDTLVLAGSGSTGTRSLAQYGVATAVKVTSTRWIISGTGLT